MSASAHRASAPALCALLLSALASACVDGTAVTEIDPGVVPPFAITPALASTNP